MGNNQIKKKKNSLNRSNQPLMLAKNKRDSIYFQASNRVFNALTFINQ
jgi:hypothetical protein